MSENDAKKSHLADLTVKRFAYICERSSTCIKECGPELPCVCSREPECCCECPKHSPEVLNIELLKQMCKGDADLKK